VSIRVHPRFLPSPLCYLLFKWLPEDVWPFDPSHQIIHDWNASTVDTVKKANEPYCKVMEDYVGALNTSLGKQIVFVVPDIEAATALRGKIIAGAAPGLTKQSQLFVDNWGHPSAPLKLLSGYCHYAVIYRRSPVGLPIPPVSAKAGMRDESLNRLLQQLAWDAVSHHPLTGITVAAR
jgi:hypothetical protein